MKKILLSIACMSALALSANATIILSNSFEYAPGPLVSGSVGSPLGVWTTHNGTANQVDVSGGAVNLTGLESEDVSTVLTNATYPTAVSNGTLYVSFTITASALPSAAAYFAHFRGVGTGDFRGRVFIGLSPTAGKFRFGVVNGSSTTVSYIPIDMDLNIPYKLVLKFVNSGLATLWVNPNSESNTANRAQGTDVPSNTFLGCYYWSWRQTTDMGVFTVDNLLIGNDFNEVALSPGAPSISPFTKQTIAADSSTGPLPFTVNDLETPAANLIVTATSDNATLIPNDPGNLVLGGSGLDRMINIIPAAGQQGSATVSLVVTDGDALTATGTIQVVVGAPTIQPITAQTTLQGTPFAPVLVTVNDTETPNALNVTATSSNEGLIQSANVQITGSGTSRTLQLLAETGQSGISTITVTVSDGFQSASTTFLAGVSPNLGLILGDTFDYADGTLASVSSGFWVVYSGTSNDARIVSSKLSVVSTNADDVHAFFTNSVAFSATSGAILYSKFTANFSALPRNSGGGYFAMFKEAGNSQFRARVFAQTNGAASGKFRLAVSNAGFTQQAFPQDLSLNTTYTVVTRFNTVTGIATLWIDPVTETSPSISGIDFASPTDLYTYAFRQETGTGFGNVAVDDLLVGTAFTNVVTSVPPPTPVSLGINKQGDSVVLSWPEPRFRLQSRAALETGDWTLVPGAVSPYTNAAVGTSFYRLFWTNTFN